VLQSRNSLASYARDVSHIKLALAQVNPTVGDLSGNRLLCLEVARQAANAGANIVAFPEMVITGYPVEDLALRPSFQAASERELGRLASELLDEGLGELVAVVGYLKGTSDGDSQELGVPRGAPMNCAAVIHQGKVVANYAKHHLPNYGVFDEYRYFVPGERALVFRAFGTDIAIAICEDLWQDGGTIAKLTDESIGLLVVLNGSPYEREKDDVRLALVKRRAAQVGAPLAYVNMCGGQDELVFDGDSLVVDSKGAVLARSPQFHEDILIVDLTLADSTSRTELASGEHIVVLPSSIAAESVPLTTPQEWDRLDPLGEVYEALVTGLHDYVAKNGFASVLIGLSGGIDSAFVAALACDALGPDRVYGVSMPSEYSSEHSRTDAADLAQRMGLHFRTVPIAPMVTSYLDNLGLTGLAEENLQARVRGTTLMGISNQEGHLVLATGNKSELAVGYSTIYGDAVGGFAPIKDLPKTDVWELSLWRNQQALDSGQVPPIPESSITKPPSAELRPGQLDSDSLPDYEELDGILHAYVEDDMNLEQIVALGYHPDSVARVLLLTDRAEYKRRQYPPGTKVSKRAFGKDRRLPMTNKWQDVK
jgi:NAD+ synthase (glutamine-hydrolysing)